MSGDDGRPEGPGSGLAVLQIGGCLYTLLLLAALGWLALRDALGRVPALAIGEHGVLAGAAVGLGAGLGFAVLLSLASRLLPAVRAVESRMGGMLGDMTDAQVLGLSLLGAVAEEAFFRLAVLDALGLLWSVALFVLLNTGPGFWAWAPVALTMGLGFGGMVEAGFGLFSATLAHALINYLTLRRILPT